MRTPALLMRATITKWKMFAASVNPTPTRSVKAAEKWKITENPNMLCALESPFEVMSDRVKVKIGCDARGRAIQI